MIEITPAGARLLVAFDVAALTLALLGMRRHRPHPSGLWWGFTAIIVVLACADSAALLGARAAALALYGASYVAAVAQMAWLVRLRAPRDVDGVLDGLFYAAIVFGALWLLTAPTASSTLAVDALSVKLMFTLLHPVAVFFAIRLLFPRARTDATAAGLNVALLLVAVADVGSRLAGDGWFDHPWLGLFGLVRLAVGGAVFVPSVAAAAERRPVTGPLGRGRALAQGATLVALAIPLLAAGLREGSSYMIVWAPLVAFLGLVTTSRILRLIGWQRLAESRLRRAADIDALTSLGNRRSLMENLRRRLGEERPGGRVALLFIDLDNFKLVNDTLGHHTGDALLRAFSERLLGGLRPGDLLFRFGGDEFAVLADVQTEDEATTLGERLRSLTTSPVSIDGVPLSVGASIGVRMARDGDTADRLLSEADAAMYAAKADGRGRVRRFNAQTARVTIPDLALAGNLHGAITNHEMVLHYQPVWWLGTGIAAGAEALVRWRHPVQGVLPPRSFLGIAANIGALDALGSWVRQRAFADMAALKIDGPAHRTQVAVNVTASELLGDGIVDGIVRQLERASLAPHDVVLEITRSDLIDDDRFLRALRGLRAAGLRISLDDFGTGWASLDALARLPLTAVKFERRLLVNAIVDIGARKILAGAVQMTNDLGLIAVAEGVEKQAELELLREIGCPMVQGFLTGRPVPGLAEALAPWRGRALYEGSAGVVRDLRAV